LKLGHGNSILSLRKPHPDPSLFKLLCANGFWGRPALLNFVQCLRSSHPNVTRAEAAAIAGLEIGAADSLPDWGLVKTLMEAFEELGILHPDRPDGSEPTWLFNKGLFMNSGVGVGVMNLNPVHLALRRRVKHTLADSLAQWLRRNSFVSDSGTTTSTPGRPANYLSLPFDLVGFSYLSGIASRTKESTVSRAVVGDCLLEECNLPYAKSFAGRLDQCAAKARIWPFAFVMARQFEHGAFEYLRQRGVAMWTQSQLLGDKTAEAIQRVLTIAEGLIQQQNIDPNAFTEIFDGLENYAGLFGNLKGKLFELLVAYVFQSRTSNARLGWEIERDDQSYDVDVFAVLNTRSWAVECKGVKSTVTVPNGEVVRHFSERVPLARHIAFDQDIASVRHVTGVVVTTGTFEEESTNDVESGRYGKRPDTAFELWDRARLIQELKRDGLSQLVQVVERYYA
jgi:hypothetical protein